MIKSASQSLLRVCNTFFGPSPLQFTTRIGCLALMSFAMGSRGLSQESNPGTQAAAATETAHLKSDLASPSEAPEAESELILRVGNESNKPDGPFGPFTYGLIGHHSFANGMALGGDFMRLHEPGEPARSSFLDEAQLTLSLPETEILDQPIVLAGTLWKNRTIDMYTDIGGLEATWKGPLSTLVGVYSGTASREDISHAFIGFQVGI